MKELKELNGTTKKKLAKHLGVCVTQIDTWIRNGISTKSKYYPKIKEIFPDFKGTKPPLRSDGKIDKRYNSGRKKKILKTVEVEMEEIRKPSLLSTEFPTIRIKRKEHKHED